MSGSDLRIAQTGELCGELARRLAEAVDSGELDAISNEDLGRVFGAVIRMFASQAGEPPQPVSGNSGISATDGVIACTAILEAVGVEVFELSAWQALTDVGSLRRGRHGTVGFSR